MKHWSNNGTPHFNIPIEEKRNLSASEIGWPRSMTWDRVFKNGQSKICDSL